MNYFHNLLKYVVALVKGEAVNQDVIIIVLSSWPT